MSPNAIEITFLVPANRNTWLFVPGREWLAYLEDRFGNWTQGADVLGWWANVEEVMTPYTVIACKDVVPEVVVKVKELFGQEAVYVRYGEAEIL